MSNQKVSLQSYNNEWFNALFFDSYFFPFSNCKSWILKQFGAKVGKRIVIKPKVNIKYPWNIKIGDDVWIGESVWIDSLTNISLGNNTCISQGAYLLTGNHNFNTTTFELITKEIVIEDGVWIGAKSIVAPGVTCFSHSVLTANSIATKNLEPYSIYQGNPAVKIKDRVIQPK
jgi:putative colanic acid biosynthesis acetyltransferase WcaF